MNALKNAPIAVLDYELTCATGCGVAQLRSALALQQSGLRANDFEHSTLPTWIGRVPELDNFRWPDNDALWHSRNNALIHLALHQGQLLTNIDALATQFGRARIGIIMGSSTSSIDRSELAYRHLTPSGELAPEFQQENVLNPHAPGLYLAHLTGISGPNMTINTACSSSAKVFASAARWLQAGLVDAVLVGGADTLCLSVLQGFDSLQLVSEQRCKPFDDTRDGINLGEGAGFSLLARSGEACLPAKALLRGYGESSDAHHMSHPHPEGEGARRAIEQALARADLAPADIDYINLHGTASRANDSIEGKLIANMFGAEACASSTKAWMGHTLGAAGIIESLVAVDALHTGLVPGTLNLQQVDSDIPLALFAENRQKNVHHVMSNSFGFGGNNACLIFSEANV